MPLRIAIARAVLPLPPAHRVELFLSTWTSVAPLARWLLRAMVKPNWSTLVSQLAILSRSSSPPFSCHRRLLRRRPRLLLRPRLPRLRVLLVVDRLWGLVLLLILLRMDRSWGMVLLLMPRVVVKLA